LRLRAQPPQDDGAMLVRLDLHHAVDIPAGSDGTVRLGQYTLDTSNCYGSRHQWAALEYDRATVSLVADPGEVARSILFTAPPRAGARLWLEPWVLSPLAHKPLRIGRRLLHAFIAPRQGRDEDFEANERAVNARITEWEATFGWHYLGVFRVHGIEPNLRADLYVIDARDGVEAARKAYVDEPDDIARIHHDARRYIDRVERRYQLWMSPVSTTAAARSAIRLADRNPGEPG
jgi:hypothetical protein